jgi:integrase
MVGLVSVRPKVVDGKKTGKWLVDIPASLTGSGRRVRRLFDNRRRAEEVAREIRRRIDPVSGKVITKTPKSGVTFEHAAAGWRADEELRVETLKKRASTFEIDGYRLRNLNRYFGKDDIKTISARKIAEYQAMRLKRGLQPMTINSEVHVICRVLGWAQKSGYLESVPEIENIPVRPKHEAIPSPEEVVRIIEALPERLKALVRFLAETGCRVGEARNLSWECVDEIGGYVEIRAWEGWTPKTQQSERRIPLNPDLLHMIRDLPKEGPYVFAGPGAGKPIGDFRKAFNAAVKKADIRRHDKRVELTPKVLRKAHATWQAERGVAESVLQGLMGHAKGSRITRRFYIHASEEAKKAAVITLPRPSKTGM